MRRYQAAVMVTLFLWRDCQLGADDSAIQINQTEIAATSVVAGLANSNLFDAQSQQEFASCLQARFR